MSVTSGEFSVREPNRQGHEWFGGRRNNRHGGILASGTPFAESDAGEAKLSNCSRALAAAADCSTPRAVHESVFS